MNNSVLSAKQILNMVLDNCLHADNNTTADICKNNINLLTNLENDIIQGKFKNTFKTDYEKQQYLRRLNEIKFILLEDIDKFEKQ